MPGVAATLAKLGASKLGERASTLSTAWHPAQLARANVSPVPGLPTSWAWTGIGKRRTETTVAAYEIRTLDTPNLKPQSRAKAAQAIDLAQARALLAFGAMACMWQATGADA